MKKRFVSKRKSKFPSFVVLVLILLIFFFMFIDWGKIDVKINNSDFVKYLLSSSNASFNDDISLGSVVILDPSKILASNYDGLVEYDIARDNDLLEDYEFLQEVSKYVIDPYTNNDNSDPLVYIYNTHQLETYASSSLAEEEIVPNVMMASYLLREELNKLGLPSIVEESNFTDILNTQGLSYSYSYTVSKSFMESAKEKYSSLKYYIDVHRDSAGRDITFKTINGKNYARVLFVVGLEHDNYQDNLEIAYGLHNLIENLYPGLSRGVYKKSGTGVNGIYNQDVDPNVILLECGGVDNTIEEVANTIEAFSIVLSKYNEGLL